MGHSFRYLFHLWSRKTKDGNKVNHNRWRLPWDTSSRWPSITKFWIKMFFIIFLLNSSRPRAKSFVKIRRGNAATNSRFGTFEIFILSLRSLRDLRGYFGLFLYVSKLPIACDSMSPGLRNQQRTYVKPSRETFPVSTISEKNKLSPTRLRICTMILVSRAREVLKNN